MKTEKRGRKSAAALAVIGPSGIETVRRPEPPEDLTEEQADEWRAIVNRLPADWFPRETWGLLAQYCRHVSAARRVAQMVESLEATVAAEVEAAEDDKSAPIFAAAKTMDRLLKMQEREGRAMSSLATRMRISQQATVDKRKQKPTQAKRPWE